MATLPIEQHQKGQNDLAGFYYLVGSFLLFYGEIMANKTNKSKNAQINKAICRCRKCGVELIEDNCRSPEMLYCVDCESQTFEELEKQNGTCLAMYLSCARFDLPLYPMLLTDERGKLKKEIETADNKWFAYLELLEESGKMEINDRMATFQDGETYLLRIFGREMSEKTFGSFVINERKSLASKEGTQIQRETWGERPLYQNVPMTTEIYNELDKRYEARMARLKGISIDEQLVDTQRKLCKMLLAQDHLLSLGDVAAFEKLQKAIDSIQAAEQLRKKDEKPIEEMRLDSLVLALENAGLMEGGELLTFDELIDVLMERFPKSKKYNYSIDVAQQVLLDIINSMRANADLMQLVDMPEEYRLVDEHGEFEPEETEQEKEAKRYLGLTKVQFEKEQTDKKKVARKKNA